MSSRCGMVLSFSFEFLNGIILFFYYLSNIFNYLRIMFSKINFIDNLNSFTIWMKIIMLSDNLKFFLMFKTRMTKNLFHVKSNNLMISDQDCNPLGFRKIPINRWLLTAADINKSHRLSSHSSRARDYVLMHFATKNKLFINNNRSSTARGKFPKKERKRKQQQKIFTTQHSHSF